MKAAQLILFYGKIGLTTLFEDKIDYSEYCCISQFAASYFDDMLAFIMPDLIR